MLAHIVAGDVGQAASRWRRAVRLRALGGVAVRAAAQSPPAPGAAEVEAVEMGDLAVGAVADRRPA